MDKKKKLLAYIFIIFYNYAIFQSKYSHTEA